MKRNPKNFNKDFPLWKACGLKDNIRTGMHYISFANGYAYATDSHILVKARLTDISDFDEMDLAPLDGKFIHGCNFKKILQSKGIVNITEEAIEVVETDYTVHYPLLKGIRFPECEKAMVGSDEIILKRKFALRANYLNTLSEIMDCWQGVQMEWKSNHMFEVSPVDGNKDIKGVIMTMMVTEY